MLFDDSPIALQRWGARMQLSDRIGRRMKLHDLHVLMAVVQAGSMSKAARLLNTTQSAVSRSIAELEQAIGAKLLDRGAQGVQPTRYGGALLKRGVAVFDELKQGVQEIEFLSDPGAGELHIGGGPTVCEGIVLAVIEQLSQRYPRVVFHVQAAGMLALFDELRARRIELGFSQLSGAAPEDIDQEVLFEEPLVVVAGIENPWVRRRKIRLAELIKEPWTWPPPGTAFDALVLEAFRASGLEPPRATVYAAAINIQTRLATSGRFLAVVPAYTMSGPAKHPSLKVLPVELPTTRRSIGILTLKGRTLSPLAELFMEVARELATPLRR
jgi:DNA-binding transcriptional LysR family regulator